MVFFLGDFQLWKKKIVEETSIGGVECLSEHWNHLLAHKTGCWSLQNEPTHRATRKMINFSTSLDNMCNPFKEVLQHTYVKCCINCRSLKNKLTEHNSFRVRKKHRHRLHFWFLKPLFSQLRRIFTDLFGTLPLCFETISETTSFVTSNNRVNKIWMRLDHFEHIVHVVNILLLLFSGQGIWNKPGANFLF